MAINFATEKTIVEHDPNKVSLDRIAAVIREAGYEPRRTAVPHVKSRRQVCARPFTFTLRIFLPYI